MDLANLSIESSSPHPHKAIDFQAMRPTISGNTSICVKKHLIPNVIAARNLKNTYLIFRPVYLAMYYTGWKYTKIFVEAKKNTLKQKNFCANIFHCLTLWRINQHLTIYNTVFGFSQLWFTFKLAMVSNLCEGLTK